MTQVLAISLVAVKAMVNLIFEGHPVEEQIRAQRVHGEQIRLMGWQ